MATGNEHLKMGIWDKFKIAAEFGLSLVALIWAVLSWFLLQYHENQTRDRQAQIAIEAMRLQQKISGGQIASSLIPRLVEGSDIEREGALLILATVAPDLAQDISRIRDKNATTTGQKHIVPDIHEVSVQSSMRRDFRQTLENARVYQRFGLYASADREYMLAEQHIPSQSAVNRQKINEAILLYKADRYYEAARLFEEAFNEISSP